MSDGFAALMKDVNEGHPRAPRVVSFDDLPANGEPHDLVNVAFGMEYQSAKELSRRWVTVRKVETFPPAKMSAFCWVSRRVKSFRLDRIQTVYDGDGVCMDPAAFFKRFGLWVSDIRASAASRPARTAQKPPRTRSPEELRALEEMDNARRAAAAAHARAADPNPAIIAKIADDNRRETERLSTTNKQPSGKDIAIGCLSLLVIALVGYVVFW